MGGAYPTLAHFYAAEAMPVLRASRASSKSVVLSWPAPATGYSLQSAPAVTGPNWGNIGPTPQQVGDQMQVAIGIGTTNTFFRLTRQ